MSLTGEPDDPPARVGASMVDYMTGATAAVGLLSGIMRARQTGIGCDVDSSLFDVALHQLGYSAVWYLNEKDVSRRQPRSAHTAIAPVQTFPTADGWIFVMCMTDKFWDNLIGAIGRSMDPLFQVLGEMPVDVLQSFFAGLDPLFPVGCDPELLLTSQNPQNSKIEFVAHTSRSQRFANQWRIVQHNHFRHVLPDVVLLGQRFGALSAR
jgi:hypothetical protein